MKKNMDKLNYIKVKNTFVTSNTIKKIRHPTDREKVFII